MPHPPESVIYQEANAMENLSQQQLFHRMKRIGVAGTILHVGAHPDDEEIGLFPYIAYKHHGRVIYWSATRGESGQNRINSYQGDSLGVYRTWESLAVREMDGGECIFGPFVDFGFSKDAEETFAKWNRNHILRELVRAIRIVQPHVVISRWSGMKDDGHGQHQAIGQVLMEAFDLAGSPESFPDLVSCGFPPWRPSKLYCSTNKTMFPSGRRNGSLENEGFLRINAGEYDPLIGCTYQELAFKAYGRHQTQGIAALPESGDFYYYLHLIKSTVPVIGTETDLFHGLDTNFPGIVSGAGAISGLITTKLKEVGKQVRKALEIFCHGDPLPASVPLLEGLEMLRDLKARLQDEPLSIPERQTIEKAVDIRVKGFEEIIGACMGLRLESICTRGKVTPGESVWVKNKLWNFRNINIRSVTFRLNMPDDWHIRQDDGNAILGSPDDWMDSAEVVIGNRAELSCPYWLKISGNGLVHESPDEKNVQQPLSLAPVSAKCIVSTRGHTITLSSPTLYRSSFPGGYKELPIAVVPPISLHPELGKKMFFSSNVLQTFTFRITARCNDEERPADGCLRLIVPEGWRVDPPYFDVTLPPVEGAKTYAFQVSIPPDVVEGHYDLTYTVRCRQREYGVIFNPVRMGAPGLPHPDNALTCIKEEFLLSPSRVSVHMINARYRTGKKYAYIEGAKEELLSSLQSVGLNFHTLTDTEIAYGNLDVFDTILVGPNAYTVRDKLADNSQRLLTYVDGGGTLIVQYHGYEYQKPGLAPYPFQFNRPHDRVTNKDAEVHMLAPEDPLLLFPNTIGPDDFSGWVHDRGLYFFGQWDGHYTPLLSCADSGEPQKEGGLVKCRYGKGTYIYIGYSLNRQIPAGVAGAYRLLFNLISFVSADEASE
jgi:LmbE family N-acetylglucosaminyl deacetylase